MLKRMKSRFNNYIKNIIPKIKDKLTNKYRSRLKNKYFKYETSFEMYW